MGDKRGKRKAFDSRRDGLASGDGMVKNRFMSPYQILWHAASDGDLETVKRVFNNVAYPSAGHHQDMTPLHRAVLNGHVSVAEFLIDAGCDVNAEAEGKSTPLHCAAFTGNFEMLQLLVENGAGIFNVSDCLDTPADLCKNEFPRGFEYLKSIADNFGIENNGYVYALGDYVKQLSSELSFKEGYMMKVLAKDILENHWFYCQLGNEKGFVPRELIGLYPRAHNRPLYA